MKDGEEVVLGVGSDRQFESLCALLSTPKLAQDERFRTNPDRVAHREALNQLLQSAIGKKDRDPFLDACEKAGIPAGAARRMDEVMEAAPPHLTLRIRDGRETGVRESVVWPALPSDPIQLTDPPHYASSTRTVLKDVLGTSDDEVDRLLEQRVIDEAGRQ